MKQRIKEIDYLKCIFITLMVAFHLVYIGDKYPYAKQIVYTFHMSAFLFLSGYLVNIEKGCRPFLKKYLWIFIPYACMELGYAVASYYLPVREGLSELNFKVLMCKLFIHPIGPYWYLHTLIVCSLVYYAVFRCRLTTANRLILLGVCLFAASCLGLVVFDNALYFLIGAIVCQSRVPFARLFRPSIIALIPMILLCCFPENLSRGSLAGVAITYLAICIALVPFGHLPESAKARLCHIGENTLVILLFSPLFTILSKAFLPFFAFDSSGMLFLLVAVLFTMGGSMGVAWTMDKLHLSPLFFGKGRVLSPFGEKNERRRGGLHG